MKMVSRKTVSLIFLYIFFIVLYGELDFRWLPHETRLEYDVHDRLYFRLRPNQVGFEWMANMTRKSPPITINSIGLRGKEVDVYNGDRKRIIAVGSSSALGSGVEDNETWTAVLQEKLGTAGLKVDVMNAANPGWGPFQHAAFIEHESDQYNPHAAIVMIKKGDFGFLPKTSKKEELAFLDSSRRRKKLLSISPFFTFSLRKGELLIKKYKRELNAMLPKAVAGTVKENRNLAKSYGLNSERWKKHRTYWKKIADFAEKNEFPVIFFVVNAEDNRSITNIADYLHQFELAEGVVQVVELNSDAVQVSSGQNIQTYAEDHLEITGDGHPNTEYHSLMGDFIAEKVIWKQILK